MRRVTTQTIREYRLRRKGQNRPLVSNRDIIAIQEIIKEYFLWERGPAASQDTGPPLQTNHFII